MVRTQRTTLIKLAKEFGFIRTKSVEFREGIKSLKSIGAIQVKHGVMYVRDYSAVCSMFGKPCTRRQYRAAHGKHEIIAYQFTCKLPNGQACTSRKKLNRLGMVCIFRGTCNQKISFGEKKEKEQAEQITPIKIS